jgi:hypothetical protein
MHKLFFVADEAQVAATRGMESLRSGDGSEKRPFLREILPTLSNIPGITIILSGTGLSSVDVQRCTATGVGKDNPFRISHDTGWFGDENAQYQYWLYLPQKFLGSERGRRLCIRIATWLRAGINFTALYQRDLNLL